MRTTVCLFGAVAAALLLAGPALAQQGGATPGFQPAFPGGQPFDPQQIQEKLQAEMARTFGLKVPAPAVKWGGMVLEPAGEALLDQLDLPAGKGMVVAGVEADSPAAKAGLKKNDLLLKVNQQAIPGEAKAMLKALGSGGADSPVDLVVLRKGKEQTLKGVKLPEAALAMPSAPAGFPQLPRLAIPPIAPIPLPAAPLAPPLAIPLQPGETGSQLSINRNNDSFDAAYQKDKLRITVRGKIEGKQATADEITIDDGQGAKKYTRVADVPMTYRETVERVLQGAAGGGLLPALPGPPPLPPPPAGAPAK
jgi:membrane-associated protease RseP (regulator of RpoE activity)